MSNYFSVHLPTKPFLVKYLESLYGSPVVFSSDQFFGMLLVAALEKNVYRDRSQEAIQYKAFEVLNKNLTVHFPKSWLTNYYHGTGIKTERAIFITKIFENRFEEDLYRHVKVRPQGQLRTRSIEEFADQHNLDIDVDVTLENLVKMEYRFRKKLEKKREINPLHLSAPKTEKVA